MTEKNSARRVRAGANDADESVPSEGSTASKPRPSKENPETGPFYAKIYAEAGFRIVPCREGEKLPACGDFGKDNPTFTIRWEDWGDKQRVALLPGPCPALGDDWLLGVDFDNGATRAMLEEHIGPLPPTVTSKEGRHELFRLPPCAERDQLRQHHDLINTKGGPQGKGPAVDLKWHGGILAEDGNWDGFSTREIKDHVPRIATLTPEIIGMLAGLYKKTRSTAKRPSLIDVVNALAKIWPQPGQSCHDAALALGGFMGRGDIDEDEAENFCELLFTETGTTDRTAGDVLPNFRTVQANDRKPVKGVFGEDKLREILIAAGHSRQMVSSVLGKLRAFCGVEDFKFRPGPGDVCLDDLSSADQVALFESVLAGRPCIFERHGDLVRVQNVSRTLKDGAAIDCLGIKRLDVAQSQLELSRSGKRFCKTVETDKGSRMKPIDPVDGRVLSMMLGAERQKSTQTLAGICESPRLRPDGTILQEPGYDSATGWYYEPGLRLERQVADCPTEAELDEAKAALVEPWAQFPWVGSVHALLPIAIMLTLLARPAISGPVPILCIDASTPGSGKGKAHDAAVLIALGNDAGKATFTLDQSELEKTLAASALEGDSLVAFDNVEIGQRFGGAAIDKAVTASRVKFRILGETKNVEVPWTALITVTGNNLRLQSDTIRRALVARLEPKVDRPENETGWRISGPLEAWALANRARLVWAGLTLLRGYVAAGRPNPGPALGSFAGWSRVVADCLQWAYGADIRKLAASQTVESEEFDAAALVAAGLKALTSTPFDGGPTSGDMQPKQILYWLQGCTAPGATDVKDGLASVEPDRKTDWKDRDLGAWLSKQKGRFYGGVKFDQTKRKGRTFYWAR